MSASTARSLLAAIVLPAVLVAVSVMTALPALAAPRGAVATSAGPAGATGPSGPATATAAPHRKARRAHPVKKTRNRATRSHAGASAAAPAPAAGAARRPAGGGVTPRIDASSPNWAGISRGGVVLSSVSTTFQVPTADLRCGAAGFSAIFVGLGGRGSLPFLQNGISIDGLGHIGVWYEMFTATTAQAPVMVPLVVHSGEVLHLGLSIVGDVVRFKWSNVTTGLEQVREVTGASRYLDSPGGSSSASWILERPDQGRLVASLQPLFFTDAWATTVGGRTVGAGDQSSAAPGQVMLLRNLSSRPAVVASPEILSGSSASVTTKDCGQV